MKCRNCGREINDTAARCGYCNAIVKPEQRKFAVQQPAAPRPVVTPPSVETPRPVVTPPPVNKKPEKKTPVYKKWWFWSVISIVLILIVGVVFLVMYLSESKKAEEAPAADAGLVLVTDESGINDMREEAVSSDNLVDMAFIINGIEYQFPLKLQDFTVNGWSLSAEGGENDSIPAGGTLSHTFVSGDQSFNVVFFNPTSSALPVKDCYIGEVSSTWIDITLAKNITTHASTRADVIAAYGQPLGGSTPPFYYYGTYSSDEMYYNYPMMNTKQFYTFKFDENTAETGGSDSDKLLYVNIQWYDPDAVNRYNERSGN